MWQVAGHDWVVRVLDSSIATGRVSHAYLLAGPQGVGKSTLAKNLAQALLCQGQDKPCGDCEACRKIIAANHPDVRVVDLRYQALLREESLAKQKELRVDTIRSVTNEAGLKPFEGARKVLLIPDADHMNHHSANSLLKTLEEPPPHVVLVLTATDPHFLLPTIVSRCQVLSLRFVPLILIEQELRLRHGVEEERARLLAGLSGGRIGWAIRAAQDDSVLQQRASTLQELAALPRRNRLDRLDYAQRLSHLPDGTQDILDLWLSWWRDLLLIRGGSPEIIGNVDFSASLEQEAHRYDLWDIATFLEAIRRTQRQLKMNTDARLTLEVLLLDLPPRSN
jgi:DNA polymerase-3 subunit delta'